MKRITGFTLIEIMVTLAILGIIVVIAVPVYNERVVQARRNDAKQQLLRLQLAQEQYRLENNAYATTAQLGVPVTDWYTYNVVAQSATGYTLSATAKGAQTDDEAACQTLTLDQSMTKTPAACW